MPKRLVDIDDELLAEATKVLGAKTMKDTVNGALEYVVRGAALRRDFERLRTMKGIDLDKPEVMKGAWR